MQTTALSHLLRSCCAAGMTAGTLLALPACTTNTISLPTADNTPPTVELVVSREPLGRPAITRIARPGGNAIELDICPDDTLVLRANARDDDGGIRSVGVQGSATGTCAQGNPAQPIGQSVSGSPAAAGDRVPTQRTVAQNVRVVDFACPSAIPNPLIATVTGTASNYYGGTVTTSPVTLRYPPVSFSCSGDPCFVPLNATLVSTHNESCNETDSVQVNQHVPREIISAGECKAFRPRPDAHPVPWWCVGPGSPIPAALSPNNTACGAGANFVRVSRNATGSSFRIDCYQVP